MCGLAIWSCLDRCPPPVMHLSTMRLPRKIRDRHRGRSLRNCPTLQKSNVLEEGGLMRTVRKTSAQSPLPSDFVRVEMGRLPRPRLTSEEEELGQAEERHQAVNGWSS